MMPIKVAFVIVLYDKKVNDSTTIKSLLLSGISDVTVVIHNNGPQKIELDSDLIIESRCKNVELKLNNCTSNKPLSVIYNDFIEEYNHFDKFIIFDDDSEVTSSFIKAIYDCEYDVQLPLIISRIDGKIYYPMTYGKVVEGEGTFDPQCTHSIGSGLIIDKRVVDIFKSKATQLFDEHYALYGVDISFFRRIWLFSTQGDVFKFKTSSRLIHSLSRAEGEESTFRRKERLIDFAITVRHYPSARGWLSYGKRMLLNVLYLRFSDIHTMCDALIHGNHPRCRNR
ncbi:glycosyltransferase family 2 protein [Raoultella scottii]|uniref:glycosyltransferase family 2 protein n=1 Tax=Raoultella scottii TaxID=3040937 RepID=UPI002FB2F80F